MLSACCKTLLSSAWAVFGGAAAAVRYVGRVGCACLSKLLILQCQPISSHFHTVAVPLSCARPHVVLSTTTGRSRDHRSSFKAFQTPQMLLQRRFHRSSPQCNTGRWRCGAGADPTRMQQRQRRALTILSNASSSATPPAAQLAVGDRVTVRASAVDYDAGGLRVSYPAAADPDQPVVQGLIPLHHMAGSVGGRRFPKPRHVS